MREDERENFMMNKIFLSGKDQRNIANNGKIFKMIKDELMMMRRRRRRRRKMGGEEEKEEEEEQEDKLIGLSSIR